MMETYLQVAAALRRSVPIEPVAVVCARVRRGKDTERVREELRADQVDPLAQDAAAVDAWLLHKVDAQATPERRSRRSEQDLRRLLQYVLAMDT